MAISLAAGLSAGGVGSVLLGIAAGFYGREKVEEAKTLQSAVQPKGGIAGATGSFPAGRKASGDEEKHS